MTLASTLTAVIRRTSSKANRKAMSRMRRLQRQVKALREEVRAQRRLVAGLERRFARLKTRLLRTGMSGGPGASNHASVNPRAAGTSRHAAD